MKLAFTNGYIHTVDEHNSIYSTLLIEGNKIVAVGDRLSTETYEEVDLNGKHVYPGLIDSHMHLVNCGYLKAGAQLFDVKSVKDFKRPIRKYIEDNKLSPTDWIQGRGWNNDYFTEGNEFPTRYDLDAISETNPIIVVRVCGHVATCNTVVLKMLNMENSAPEVVGGEIDIDENGVPLGIFRESALNTLYSVLPKPSVEEVKEMILSTVKEMNSFGLTGSQTDDLCTLPGSDPHLIIRAYSELKDEGLLTMRICEQSLFETIDEYREFLSHGYTTGWGDEHFKIGPLKLLMDGSLGAKTAALRAPYEGEETCGISIQSEENLDQWLSLAAEHKMNAAVHCIGDGALERTLNGLVKHYDSSARNSIVHCQITDREQIKTLAREGILAMVQPIFLEYDHNIVKSRVGEEREATSYAWKTMIDEGVSMSFGTDAPVEYFNPFHNIYEAVTRRDLAGNPKGGWLPNEAVSPEEAIRAYTIEGAYASFEEDIKGSLEVGKLADFFIVEESFSEMKPDDIKDVQVLETYFDGVKVY